MLRVGALGWVTGRVGVGPGFASAVSTAPAAPRRWPVAPLVAETSSGGALPGRKAASAPMACASAASPAGVEVA